MSITKNERTLDYIKIVGPGVDALERRKEHNNNNPVSATGLRASIDKVKASLFEGIKMLTSGASGRIGPK